MSPVQIILGITAAIGKFSDGLWDRGVSGNVSFSVVGALVQGKIEIKDNQRDLVCHHTDCNVFSSFCSNVRDLH